MALVTIELRAKRYVYGVGDTPSRAKAFLKEIAARLLNTEQCPLKNGICDVDYASVPLGDYAICADVLIFIKADYSDDRAKMQNAVAKEIGDKFLGFLGLVGKTCEVELSLSRSVCESSTYTPGTA